jgi:hypothetical protein
MESLQATIGNSDQYRINQINLTQIAEPANFEYVLITLKNHPAILLAPVLKEQLNSIEILKSIRQHAWELKTQFFVITDSYRTYLFKTEMGPLRELQLRLWQDPSGMGMQPILHEILSILLDPTKPKPVKNDRKLIFLENFDRILRNVVAEYRNLLSNGLFNSNSNDALALIHVLQLMGVDLDWQSDQERKYALGNLATQIAFINLNRMFCYNVIRAQFRKQFNIDLAPLYDITAAIPFETQIEVNYRNIVEKYEFAPIFRPDPIFSRIPNSSKLNSLFIEFLAELNEFDLENLEEDFVGEIYQALLPIEKKKEFGQVYTPTDIAKTMVKLAIRHPDDKILDPSCGCGTFLREAYSHLCIMNKSDSKQSSKELNASQLHQKLLSQIWGVEINTFPAHLSMMTLSFMHLENLAESVGILIDDFLNIGPMKKYSIKTKNIRTGEITTRDMPAKFDVIIANPPYIKQEKIPNKESMMRQLPEFASYRLFEQEGEKTGKAPKIKLELTGKTDYYGFFLWYSTFLLKEHGILCYLIPNKWMDVQYGENLKQFLLDHYHIRAIIGFGRNIFTDAQVSTVILVLERLLHPNPDRITRFIYITSENGKDQLENLVYQPLSVEIEQGLLNERYIFSNPTAEIQCTYVPQKRLIPTEKWSFKYLFQSEFNRVLDLTPTILLHNQEISTVLGGIKTGANDFFYPSPDLIKKNPIELPFLKPGIKSGRSIPEETIITHSEDHFLAISADIPIQKYPNLRKYIEQGVHFADRPSVNWKPWYCIPEDARDCPDILFLRHIDSDFRARWNHLGCIVADGVRGIKLRDPDHLLFYLGVLNSTFFYWQAHIRGRWEGQGDLQLLVYELKNFVIPDIHQVNRKDRIAVERAMQDLLDREQKLIQNPKYQTFSRKKRLECLRITISIREALDRAVLRTLHLENCYEILIRETILLETYRLTKKI